MKVLFHLIDAFTSTRFRGNPTPVCVSDAALPAEWMQAIAKELNLPVAAFVSSPRAADAYPLQYYTSTGAIPACGHATLAAAKAMGGLAARSPLRFVTAEGLVIEARTANGIVYLTYPRYQPYDATAPPALLQALGIRHYRSVFFCQELESLFIELDDALTLKALAPDYGQLTRSSSTIKEVVVTSVADTTEHDFLLRSFCPWIGINEDPVTGSVHSVLAHHWQSRLGKNSLKAYQASERGGEVYLKAGEDGVELGGAAVAVLRGELEM